jgi:hypothetical protein
LVVLSVQGHHHLAVGGGGNRRLLVCATEDNLSFWNLTDPGKRGVERKVRMNIGDQEGEYRESQFVSRDVALRAARRYVEDGHRAADLTWRAS